MSELEYLAAYMRERHYTLRMWGENAGDAGDPQEIDEEVLLNGLYGQDYVGANLFAADHVTPTRQFFDLQNAHRWLADVWRGRINPVSTFKNLLVRRGGCVYADVTHSISLCPVSYTHLDVYKRQPLPRGGSPPYDLVVPMAPAWLLSVRKPTLQITVRKSELRVHHQGI